MPGSPAFPGGSGGGSPRSSTTGRRARALPPPRSTDPLAYFRPTREWSDGAPARGAVRQARPEGVTVGATGLSADPREYRRRLDDQPDPQIDAWAQELLRDVVKRRGVG